MNYYETLEVAATASASVIKAAYKALSQKYHPDKNHGNKAYEEKMALINQAFDILSNPESRQVYDEHLNQGQGQGQGQGQKQDYDNSKGYENVQSNDNSFNFFIYFFVIFILFFITVKNTQETTPETYEKNHIKPSEIYEYAARDAVVDAGFQTNTKFSDAMPIKEANKGVWVKEAISNLGITLTPVNLIEFSDKICKTKSNEYYSCTYQHLLVPQIDILVDSSIANELHPYLVNNPIKVAQAISQVIEKNHSNFNELDNDSIKQAIIEGLNKLILNDPIFQRDNLSSTLVLDVLFPKKWEIAKVGTY